jgi:AAA domain/CHC2 zinc finger
MQLTFEQIHKVFEHYLAGQRITSHSKQSRRCPFHEDRSASMTVFISGNGGYNCHGCGAHGNVFQFVAEIESLTVREAEGKVSELTGAKLSYSGSDLGPPVALYDYYNANERLVFQKRKYQPQGRKKEFRQFQWSDEENRWVSNLAGVERILYHLPQAITANVLIVTEGEKDANRITETHLYRDHGERRVVATCTTDGAWAPGQTPKWLPAYNAYFAGKMAVILADNDQSGEAYATHIAAAVFPYAFQVKVVRLPGLPEHGDVSDWLDAGHTRAELEAEIYRAPAWQPSAEPQHAYDQDAVSFAAEAPANVDWLVEDLIPRGSGGIFGGVPKATKSMSALDLGMSLACGVSWLGLKIPARVKTYLVSREDAPGLTQRRIKQLIAGRAEYSNLSDWMRITTRRHVADLQVTTEEHLVSLIAHIRAFGAELVILDVFRKLYKGDENENSLVDSVLEKVNRIRSETGAAIALVHHIRKAETADIFSGLRGAGVIFGWMEWGVGIRVLNPEEKDRSKWIREMEFESKESTLEPITYHVVSSPDHATLRLEITTRPQKSKVKAARAAELLEVPTDWQQRHDLQRESRA